MAKPMTLGELVNWVRPDYTMGAGLPGLASLSRPAYRGCRGRRWSSPMGGRLNDGCAHGSGHGSTRLAPRAFHFRKRSHHQLLRCLLRAVSLPAGTLSLAWLVDGRPTRTTRWISDGVTACACVPRPNGLINRRFCPCRCASMTSLLSRSTHDSAVAWSDPGNGMLIGSAAW